MRNNWWKYEVDYGYKFNPTVCFKGGGSTSGAVDYPDYMEAVHGDWLNTTGVDTIEKSVTEVMDTALGNSPWAGLTAYDP